MLSDVAEAVPISKTRTLAATDFANLTNARPHAANGVGDSMKRRMNEDLMIEALRNENRFLQEEVDRYRMQNKELIELIFKLRKKNGKRHETE